MNAGKPSGILFMTAMFLLTGIPGAPVFPQSGDSGLPNRELPRRNDTPGRTDVIVIPADSPQLKQLKIETARFVQVPGLVVTAPGRIVFDVGRVSRVLMPVPGRIDQVLVRLGDRVSPGQVLLTIDSAEADGAVAECRQAGATLLQARSALAKAQADEERARDLFDHKAVAQKEVLAAEHEVTQAGAEVEQAEASLAHGKRRLDILGLQPDEPGQKLSVRAKLGGKVIDLSVTPGEYRSDTNVSLMTVADLSKVWVMSEVPETSIRFIEVGEKLQLELVAYPSEVFEARVTRIADSVDPKTRTVQVLAELPNPDGRLRPEMFGRIRHSHPTRPLPVVPPQAIVHTSRGPFLFVEREPGRFERLYVQTGDPIESGVPILSGIKAGDRIVVGGIMLLAGGMI
jgi:membrane fusion protein, heavy metal efflux system